MFFSKPWFRLLWLIALAVSLVLTSNLFKVESSLLKLLPKYESEQTNHLISKATERVNKQLVLMASSDDQIILIDSFKNSLQILENKEYINTINYQVQLSQVQDIYQVLAPHQHKLLSPGDQQAIAQGLGADYFVQRAQEYLYGVQQFSVQQLNSDPLFLWQRLIASMSNLNVMSIDTSASYYMVNGNDSYHMVAFVELTDSAFSPENQLAVIRGIDAMKASLQSQQVDLAAFGAVRYVHKAFQDAKQEISTVGLGSLMGIVLLVVVVFRSVMPLLLSISCIALGLATSLGVALLVFEQIHAFALVFGATIAGVSIDYCFHYLVIASFSQNDQITNSEQPLMQQIFPGLLMGFSSSALVYLGFLITGYEVLAQIALFSVVGLLAVLINVLVFFPWLYRAKLFKQPDQLLRIAQKVFNNPIQKLFRNPVLPLVLLITTVLGSYLLIKPNDDVRALQQLSPTLKQEEAYIREVLAWPSSEYYVLIAAENINAMLQHEAEVLSYLRDQNHDIVGVSDFIPSLSQQQQQHQQQQDLYATAEVKAYLEQLQLPDPTVGGFTPLDVNVLQHEAFGMMFKQRWVGAVNGEQALIIPLQKSVDLHHKLPSGSHAILIQQAKDTSELFTQFRIKSTWMLGFAVLLLWLLLGVFRYGLLTAAHLVAMPLLAGFLALLLTWSLGMHISLFSILALLLILGMGLDYVVFLQESDHPQHVMVALIMSSLTTILAFGLLAFSQVAVLQSFGFMVGIGIAMVLLTAPAVTANQNKAFTTWSNNE